MRRNLLPPTRDDVSDEAVFERSRKNLAAWLGAIKAGDPEAVSRLLDLLKGSSGEEETEAGLVEFMHKACDEDALEEIFGEMQDAFESHIENLIDDARYECA